MNRRSNNSLKVVVMIQMFMQWFGPQRLTAGLRVLCLGVFCLAVSQAQAQTNANVVSPASSAAVDAVGQAGKPVASKHIALPLKPTRLNISDQFFAATDPSGTQTVTDMPRADFKPLDGPFAVGYSTKTFWLRFTLSDPAERVREWWLELEPSFIDQVDFYEEQANGQFRHAVAGDTRPTSVREVANQGFVFQLSPRAQPTTYYIRLQSSGSIFIKAQLWHNTIFAGEVVRYAHLQAATYGALLLLIFITLVQGVVVKEAIYLAFVAHAGAVLVTLASSILPLHLPDAWTRLMDAVPAVATCLTVVAYAIFCNYFVVGDQQSRIYRWLFYALAVVGIVGALACINPDYRWILPNILILKIFGTVLPVIAASRRLMRGSWYDRLVWLGLVVYLPAQAILYWRLTNVFATESVWVTIHMYTAVILVHMVLMTFALAERMRRIARARRGLQDQLGTERRLNDLAGRTAFDQRSFLTMVAHELRGPLVATRGEVDSLRLLITPKTDAVLARLESADTGLQQMASLIAVCLTHEREGFAQPLSLNLILSLEQLRSRLQPVFSDAVAERLRWPVEDGGSTITQTITGNPALLAIAVRNMVETACRHDTSGGPVEITWYVEPSDHQATDHWRITVSDRGPGISADRVDKIFEPFIRGGHPEDGGIGLGLYLVSRIASMHGAKAGVQPREGGGTEYSLVFGA